MWWKSQRKWNSEAFVRRTNRALARKGSALQLDENLLVEGGDRLVSVDFDGQLTLYVHGVEAQSLPLPRRNVLLALLQGWCEWGFDADQLATEVKGFQPSERLRMLTMDLPAFVRQQWQHLAAEFPNLSPLIHHLQSHPQVVELFPFEDQGRLGLSPTISGSKRVLKEQAILIQLLPSGGFRVLRENTVWPPAHQRQIPHEEVSSLGDAISEKEALQLCLRNLPVVGDSIRRE